MSALTFALSFGQLADLQELKFEGKLCSESLSALCVGLRSGKLRSPRSLELPRVPLGDDEGTSALCQALSAEKLPELRCLKLGRVNDAGLQKLAEGWTDEEPPPLEALDLSGSFIQEKGVLALVSLSETGRLPSLWNVRVGNSVSSSMRATVKGVFPHTVVD